MTKNESMKEYQVIKHVAKYLMMPTGRAKKGWTILSISVRKKDEGKEIGKELNLPQSTFEYSTREKEADIVARRWKGRRILIEAKGGEPRYAYGIYTALGQMVCKLDDTEYTWFGLAFPERWRENLEKLIEKRYVLRLVNNSKKKGKRLYFYFVDSKGVVKRETWSQLLKNLELGIQK
jgi:hypothetical protein